MVSPGGEHREERGEERKGENSPGNIPADSPAVLKICNDRKKAVPSWLLLLLRRGPVSC